MINDLLVLGKDEIKSKIYTIRGIQVMLDFDIAQLYGVKSRRLREQVKRNIKRFPDNFMFQLTKEELENLRLQFVISNGSSRFQFGTLKRGENIKYLPYAFTEQGVAMLSGILKSKTAVKHIDN